MPRGVNEKALAARERKAAVKAEKGAAVQKAKEDAQWVDDDKLIKAKLERKKAEEAKRDEKLEQKAAKKQMEEEEAARFQSNKKVGSSSNKLTRAQIALRQLEAQKRRQEDQKQASSSAQDWLMDEVNMNHVLREQAWDRFLETGSMELTDVTGLDQALAVTTLKKSDSRPHINEKALFQEFCDTQLPILRNDQPGLKRSQYQERLWKMWQKHPSNPRVNGTIA